MTDRAFTKQEIAAGQKIRDELIRQGLITPATPESAAQSDFERAQARFKARMDRRWAQPPSPQGRW